MSKVLKIFYCENPAGIIVSTPYWEKAGVIEHMEEIEFPDTWKTLLKKGYKMIELEGTK